MVELQLIADLFWSQSQMMYGAIRTQFEAALEMY